MGERITLTVTPRPAARAAEVLADAVAEADARVGSARVAIPGGSALAAVGPARIQLGAIWRRVRLTWSDERCVPVADVASNRGIALRTGALSDDDPPGLLLPLFLDGESGEAAAARSESALALSFDGVLDVALLGLGSDGHVASLFPGDRHVPGLRVAFVETSPKPPAKRITLTQSMLATASRAVVVATGESKRVALLRLLARDPALPASALSRISVVTDVDLGRSRSA